LKQIILSAVLFFVGFQYTVNAQQTAIKNIVGLWESESTSTRLVFFYDKTNTLQLVEWDSRGGEEMQILNIITKGDSVKTTEKFVSTNFTTLNAYYLTDENTMGNIINGDNISTIYFKRKK